MRKILIISSRPPSHSAGLGNDMAKGLVDDGCKVDFLTLRCFAGKDEHLYGGGDLIFSDAVPEARPQSRWKRYWNRIVRNRYKLRYRISRARNLYYPNEWLPKVAPGELLKLIEDGYDAVITLFWEDMLNSTSLYEIYKKLRCPILIYSPDMAPMTGGCFYFEECTRFREGCGFCPKIGYGVERDVTRLNYRIKHRNYRRTDAIFMGNTWMNRHARESGLFPPGKISEAGIVINEDVFTPSPGCVDPDRFTILLRSTPEPRKGNAAMLAAINGLAGRLTEVERRRLRIISIGDKYFEGIAAGSGLSIENRGIVDTAGLVACYREADLFLSLSLNDAGPSMINQALMCGCPVVSFDNGTAMDVVENGSTGYKCSPGDVAGVADALYRMFRLEAGRREVMGADCRKRAMQVNSIPAFARAVERALNKNVH